MGALQGRGISLFLVGGLSLARRLLNDVMPGLDPGIQKARQRRPASQNSEKLLV
jgi:hypothetical protein